jgi:hypothetical protein
MLSVMDNWLKNSLTPGRIYFSASCGSIRRITSPEGAILTSTSDHDNIGDLIFAINFSQPQSFITQNNPFPNFAYQTLALYIPAPVFDKTGTLTLGIPVVDEIKSIFELDPKVLTYAAALEQFFSAAGRTRDLSTNHKDLFPSWRPYPLICRSKDCDYGKSQGSGHMRDTRIISDEESTIRHYRSQL